MKSNQPLNQYGRLLITYLKPLKGRVFLLTLLVLGGIGLQLLNPQCDEPAVWLDAAALA